MMTMHWILSVRQKAKAVHRLALILRCVLLQDFAFAFQCFMLEYWDREDTGRWPKNPSLSPNVSDDPVMMQTLFKELSKMEPNQEGNPWVRQEHVIFNLAPCWAVSSGILLQNAYLPYCAIGALAKQNIERDTYSVRHIVYMDLTWSL